MNDNNEKLKYYSFNINVEENDQLDEGFTEDKPEADYDSSEFNSTMIDLDKILKFKDDYYENFQDVKDDYIDMMNATINNDHNINSSIDKIYNTMLENSGSDINERSVKLKYVDIGEYDKRIVKGFINKINEEYLPTYAPITGIKLPDLE